MLAGSRRLAQHNTRASQVRENSRSPDQIPAGEPPRVEQQAKQPLECQLLHPDRRTPFVAGNEVERSADTQRQSACGPAGTECQRYRFLLRASHGEETESKRALALDESQAVLHG